MILSMSAINTFKRCPKKFELMYVKGLEDRRPLKSSMEQGTTLHKLLELKAKKEPWPADCPSMIDVAVEYLRHFPLPDNILSIDTPHLTPIYEDVVLQTSFDLVYEENGILVIRDYKSFDKSPTRNIGLDFQARTYIGAAIRIWPGYKGYRFEHEYIRRTPPNVPKDKAGNSWAPHECYIRDPIVYAEHEVVDDWEELESWVKSILANYRFNERWRRIDLKGGGYEQCTSCFVKNLCNADKMNSLDKQTIDLIAWYDPEKELFNVN